MVGAPLKPPTADDPTGSPWGVSLERYAEICAAVAEGDRTRTEVLQQCGLSREAWMDVQAYFGRLLAEDAMTNDEPRLASRFADDFARAQDALKPVPVLTPDAWAHLVVDFADRGLAALQDRALREADYARLARHWAKVLRQDRAQAKRYAQAIAARRV